ncbi:MAG: hypothetical protein ACEQR8_09990 [Cypionkella sp.]
MTRELVGPDDAEAHLPELADVLAFAVTRHQELDFSALASAPEGAGQPAFASTWAGGPDGTGPSPGLASEIVIEAISGADPREVPVERLVAMLTGPEPGAIGDATDAVRLPDRPIGGDLSPENAAAGAYEGIGHGSDILFAMIADHHLAAQLEAATVGHA